MPARPAGTPGAPPPPPRARRAPRPDTPALNGGGGALARAGRHPPVHQGRRQRAVALRHRSQPEFWPVAAGRPPAPFWGPCRPGGAFQQRRTPAPRLLLPLALALLAASAALPVRAQDGGKNLRRHYPGPQVEERRYPKLPAKGQGDLFDIPAGFERPVEVDEGVLIPISRFSLSGIRTEPEFAPHEPALLALLDRERRRVEGYNRERLKGAAAAQRPGMTIGQIQQAANMAAAHLRERGYFLVQAVLPEQTVADGVINILFLPGSLGRVTVESNRWYGDRQIGGVYDDMLGKPVSRRRLEWGVLSMQSLPGLKSYATLVRGRSVGQSDLLVRTQDEDIHDFALSANNSNLEETGSWQTQLDYSLNNPLGASDVLSLTMRTSLAPANNQFGSLSYDLPLSHTTSLFFSFYYVTYGIDADEDRSGITGETLNGTTRFQWQMLRSRYLNLFFSNILDWTSLSSVAGGGVIERSSTLMRYSVSLSGDWIETRINSLNTFQLSYSIGLPGVLGADKELAEDDPARLNRQEGDADYGLLNFSYQRLQSINERNSLLLKLRYNRSSSTLYSIHSTSVGGPDSLRALPSSSLLRENVLIGTLEYILAPFSSRRFNDELAWGQVLQLSLFADYALATRSNPVEGRSTPEDPDLARLGGVGASAQFIVPDLFKFRIDYAYLILNRATPGQPLTGDAPDDFDEYVYGDSFQAQSKSRIYLEIAYYF